MFRFSCIVALFLFMPTAARAQPATISDEPLSERIVSYDIDARLDPETRTIEATERVTWRNPGNVPVDELQFHLYLNAFKNANSTFMKESGGRHRGFSAEGDDVWGSVEITSMRVAAQDADPLSAGYFTEDGDFTDRIEFIHPDDGNPDDQTVIRVPLPVPVQPGETIALDIAFTSKLPKIMARTGWETTSSGEPFFMAAQWFPKLGVYEVPGQRYVPEDSTQGQWSTHQFHANSEFYANFGTYDVDITVPQGYLVGASGVLRGARDGEGTRTLTYHAADVHDFAWTASPAYEEFTDTWRHVSLRLLVQPEHAGQAQRHFDAAKAALERLDAWVGPYPYTTLTLVDGIGGSNGMEYPTLITCGTVYQLPNWFRPLELVTIHEFGHQYFYGILASNEAEEPWLDEGMNSYFELRIMDDAYGPGSVVDLPGLRISGETFQRLSYTQNNPTRGVIFTKSWEHRFSDYGKVSYAKPATVLLTLERYLGQETNKRLWRTYYDRWAFRHPTTRDFIDVAEEVSGEDLSWFFDQFIYGSEAVDYAVHSIRNRRQATGEGEAQGYESTVIVKRLEDGTFPQTLRITFDDGTVEERHWDGAADWQRFTFSGPKRVTEAYLDPQNHVVLDIDRLNNRRTTEPDTPFARKQQFKMAVWLQQAFYLIAGLL